MKLLQSIRIITVLLIFSVTAVAPRHASSQTHYQAHVHFGFHGGATMSKMSFSPSVEQKWLNGVTMGVSARYAEERHVGLLAELNLTQRGWAEDFEDAPFSYQRKMTYVELPVMTHIFFGPRNFKCFINLGPQFCYMVSSSVSSNFDYMNPASVPDFPLRYRMTEQMGMEIKNKFDYGICAGIGMEAVIRRRHSIILEGRYYYGLGNIFGASKSDTFSASRGMSIAVTLGYLFRVK